MENVWVVKNNGEHFNEEFTSSQEANNYAKRSSLYAMCVVRSQGDTAIFYEHGEAVDKKRARELKDAVVEILEYRNEKFANQHRGKAIRKKV
jgi:hypothetical protein